MPVKTFVVASRWDTAPPQDWRARLTRLLGERPRRLDLWAELGLFGALSCLEGAGEASLPGDAVLMVTSRRGTHTSTRAAIAQMEHDLPMPLTFLQSQPNQLLAHFAARTRWRGYACFLGGTSRLDSLYLAAQLAGSGGVLFGEVDDTDGAVSRWLRLRPCLLDSGDLVEVAPEALFSTELSYLGIGAGRLAGC